MRVQHEKDEQGRMGPRAACSGEGRAYRWKRESALRGDLANRREMEGAGAVRRTLLRAGRYGEPDQRAVQPVRRPRQRRNHASQSDAVVSVGCGVYPGQRFAACGAEGDGTGTGAGFHHPHQVAQDWRTDPGFRSEGLGFNGIQLSLARPLPAGLDKPALLKRHWRGRYLKIGFSRGGPARTSAPLLHRNRPTSLRSRLPTPTHSPNRLKSTTFFSSDQKTDRAPAFSPLLTSNQNKRS